MRIGICSEPDLDERRVAATPSTVQALLGLGYEVVVEQGAGVRASISDASFAEAGAEIGSLEQVWGSDVVLCVNRPDPARLDLMRPGSTLIGFLQPRQHPETIDQLAERGLTALSMDMVPRTSRAQALDALSSMANISGYRAVVEASYVFGRFFTGQVTAAGKVPPAKVLVVGAGVAGLAAIGAANAMGAVVRATDVRPETAEQVESMGAQFLQVAGIEQQASADGYARDVSDDVNQRAAQLYAEQAREVDIIITTAAIPGRPSPRLITAEMVASMAEGSVIVDLAAQGGGNCELTRPGQSFTTDNGVTIIGYTDFASRLPGQSSQLYGTNLVNALRLVTPNTDGVLSLDLDDEVVRTMTIVRDGQVLFPPPPIQVSAAVAPTPAADVAPPGPSVDAPPVRAPRPWWHQVVGVGIGAVALIGLLTVAPHAFVSLFGVFALAVVVGYYVVWNVSHALHTPLMSVTNAVSGIIIVGAMTQLASDNWAVRIIACIAVLLASINIFGGFTVTQRMLTMFRKG